MPIDLALGTFYGELVRVLEVPIPAIPSIDIPLPVTILIAVIREFPIEEHDHCLDIHYYPANSAGTLKYLDITTVQCLVARILDRGRYAIIDRSGALSRALAVAD